MEKVEKAEREKEITRVRREGEGAETKQSMYVYSVYNATLPCLSLPLTQHTTCFGLHGHPQVF
jgi:hypothetical protein